MISSRSDLSLDFCEKDQICHLQAEKVGEKNAARRRLRKADVFERQRERLQFGPREGGGLHRRYGRQQH